MINFSIRRDRRPFAEVVDEIRAEACRHDPEFQESSRNGIHRLEAYDGFWEELVVVVIRNTRFGVFVVGYAH